MTLTLERIRRAARSSATVLAYGRDWEDFHGWCGQQGRSALPAEPEDVAAFLVERGQRLRPATLERRLAAIADVHRRAGAPLDLRHPALRDVRAGLKRLLGTAPVQKAPLGTEEIRMVVSALPGTLAGMRDRSLLLLGFAGALRRSELVGLDVADIRFTGAGVLLDIRRAKEDQVGAGEVVGLPRGAHPATCPVQALKHWLMAARLEGGPLFRAVDRHGRIGEGRLSGTAVARIIKRAVSAGARQAGWTRNDTAALVSQVSGHSLRAGFVTAAAAAGLSEWEIARQTRHRSLDTVRRYIRMGSVFRGNAAGRIGL